MNSINLNALSLNFKNPWLLFLIIPAVALMLIPYFRLPKQHRKTRNRVISLVLHSVILLMLTLLLAGLSFTYTQVNVKKDVILLVDVSDSVQGSEEEMNEFIQSVLEDVDNGYSVGIVTFANDCIYSSSASAGSVNLDKIFGEMEEPARCATDISSALLYARDLFKSPKDGRIILLSDGQQTDGNAIVTVQALAEEGVRVDTVYFPSKGFAKEVQITSVEVNFKDEVSAEAWVTVDSSVAQPATITIYDNGAFLCEQPVNLSGHDIFSIEQRLSVAPMHEIRVVIDAAQDTLKQNNTYYTYLNLEVSTKTLLVDGGGKGTEKLSGVLDESFDITKITLDNLPKTVEELCRYNEVILMNVANADLPAGFDDILTKYVKDYGGGLYTVGGDKAYVQEDMNGTKFEDLLPIRANTDAKSLGLLLIIDRSSSMDVKVGTGSSTRMDLAIEAAVASVNCLADNSDDNYVGVITFDKTAQKVADMSPMSDKDAVIKKIRDIEVGYKTGYYNALVQANIMLSSFNKTELKHVIFLTDGVRTDNEEGVTEKNITDIIDQMARNNITLSTIALGPDAPPEFVEEMADHGGGRFYNVARETELRKIMVEETTVAAGQYLNKVTFTPSIVSHTAAVAGITVLPQLDGFYGSRIKEGATMVLGYQGSPIYAEWSCGLGRVGSFMCDLYGDWSSEFFTNDSGVRFITNTVKSLLSKELNKNGSDVAVSFEENNFSTRATVTARLAEGETLVAQLVAPDGESSYLKLEQLNEFTFASAFKTDIAGVYTLRISKVGNDGEKEYLSYTAFSYSKEYLAFPDDSANFKFMENLSENGRGSMLFSADNLFDRQSQSHEADFDPALVFLILSSILFLLDIVVRKFKIKLPKEIREDRKNNLSSTTHN